MQISEFTKALNYFLVGSALLFFILIWMWRLGHIPGPLLQTTTPIYPDTKDVRIPEISSGLALISVTLLLPLAVFAGVLIESVVSPIRLFLAWRASVTLTRAGGEAIFRRWCRLLGVNKSLLHMELARAQFVDFVAVLQERKREGGNIIDLHKISASDIPGISTEKIFRQLATGAVLSHASKESLNWIVSHYATYILCTNYALVAPLGLFLLAPSPLDTIAAILSIWCLTHLALEKRFYAYESVYRAAFSILALKTREELAFFTKGLLIVWRDGERTEHQAGTSGGPSSEASKQSAGP